MLDEHKAGPDDRLVPMNRYNLPAAVILLVVGLLIIITGNTGLGVVFVALGAVFLAIDQAERRRRE